MSLGIQLRDFKLVSKSFSFANLTDEYFVIHKTNVLISKLTVAVVFYKCITWCQQNIRYIVLFAKVHEFNYLTSLAIQKQTGCKTESLLPVNLWERATVKFQYSGPKY